jgi:hypothetical protein
LAVALTQAGIFELENAARGLDLLVVLSLIILAGPIASLLS